MTQIKNFFDGLVRELREERKELQQFLRDDVEETRTDVKHLWNRLEEQWDELQVHHVQMQSKASEAAEDIKEGMEHLIGELREGYRQLRKTLTAQGGAASKKGKTATSRKRSGGRGAHPLH